MTVNKDQEKNTQSHNIMYAVAKKPIYKTKYKEYYLKQSQSEIKKQYQHILKLICMERQEELLKFLQFLDTLYASFESRNYENYTELERQSNENLDSLNPCICGKKELCFSKKQKERINFLLFNIEKHYSTYNKLFIRSVILYLFHKVIDSNPKTRDQNFNKLYEIIDLHRHDLYQIILSAFFRYRGSFKTGYHQAYSELKDLSQFLQYESVNSTLFQELVFFLKSLIKD
ncbi:hypothetical protein AB837_00027 [bacterium AB1]|nr:hypothetical protein AB837_00027 [bacterium AB1]